SAPGHLAAAFGVPTVTAVGPSDPDETRPWGPLSRVVRSREDLACRPCWFTPLHGNCPHQGRCMTEITSDQIVDALLDVVSAPRSGGDRVTPTLVSSGSD
ncbi:MAG: glycosyltransferase family 9 protein, partial [Phyllobacteriaceae bacterium]|nr:glycosyltransferase family 9 protein [Phyllobacteriaceae bacterium]